MNAREPLPKMVPDISELGADELLDALVQRDPSYAEGSAIYDLVGEVSRLLKQMRNAAGLTQARLADKLGVSQGRISQIESGLPDHAPSLEMIARIGFVCGATPKVGFDAGGSSSSKGTPIEHEAAFDARMQASAVGETVQSSPSRSIYGSSS